MPDKLQIAIVGLGLIGTSAGLALRRFQDKVTVVGHDRDSEASSRAKRLGAVDRADWNLIGAISNADRVLLALPASEIRDTMVAISKELKPGCVLIDTADVKVPVMAWAAELLPQDAYFVGGHPIVLGEQMGGEGARADLFEKKLFCLTPDTGTNDTAVRLAADVVEALGARPFFLDPVEHDGMAAAVEHLPAVVAGALMAAVSRSSSWQDARKLAGNQFLASTLVAAATGKEAVAAPLANREHVVHWVDALISELGAWREHLLEADDKALEELFEEGLVAGRKWIAAQARGSWEEEQAGAEMPTAGTAFRELFLGRLRLPAERPRRK